MVASTTAAAASTPVVVAVVVVVVVVAVGLQAERFAHWGRKGWVQRVGEGRVD